MPPKKNGFSVALFFTFIVLSNKKNDRSQRADISFAVLKNAVFIFFRKKFGTTKARIESNLFESNFGFSFEKVGAAFPALLSPKRMAFHQSDRMVRSHFTGEQIFESTQTIFFAGGRHSSVVSSAPTILWPQFESQAHHLCFFQFEFKL